VAELRFDHVGIAVRSLESALAVYERLMKLEVKRTTVQSQKLNLALITVGDMYLELLEPSSEESSVAKFIRERGEGLHHIAFEVDDIERSMLEYRRKGFNFVYDRPVAGKFGSKVNFIIPKETGRVLVELTQHPG
jgi:methylmalonyl-CoA epimerase